MELPSGTEVFVRAILESPIKEEHAIAYVYIGVTDDIDGARLEVLKSDILHIETKDDSIQKQ